MTGPILIIAWGNLGRRDDGAALVLADRLADEYQGRDDVLVQQYHQLGPELVDDLGRCRRAIFIDAARLSARDEAYSAEAEVTVDRVVPASRGDLDSHHCSPEVLLGLTAALGLSVPESWLIGIRGHDWEFGDSLSEPTQRAVQEAEGIVRRLVQQG